MIRKPTELFRATCTQEARVVLGPERDTKRGLRRVQILVPESPVVHAAIDIAPDDIGPNRTYKLPELTPNAQIQFDLLPDQFIVMASAGPGNAFCAIIVEYVDE